MGMPVTEGFDYRVYESVFDAHCLFREPTTSSVAEELASSTDSVYKALRRLERDGMVRRTEKRGGSIGWEPTGSMWVSIG